MGLILKAAGANFEANAVSYIPPVADGLLYWGFLNDSIEKLGRNFAPGGGPLSVVGAPIMDAKGAVLSASNYVQLPVQQTPSLTIIVVGHPLSSDTPGMLCTNYSTTRPGGLAGITSGVSLYTATDAAGKFRAIANVSSFSGVSGAATLTNQATIFGLELTKPAFLAMTFDATEKIVRLRNLATGLETVAPVFTQAIDIGVAPFRVGAAVVANYSSSPRNMHFSAYYNRKLSNEELGIIYARVKAYLATRGVVV